MLGPLRIPGVFPDIVDVAVNMADQIGFGANLLFDMRPRVQGRSRYRNLLRTAVAATAGAGLYALARISKYYLTKNPQPIPRDLRRLRFGREQKFHDESVVGRALIANTNYTGSTVNPTMSKCLNAVPPGEGPQERLGRSIVMQSIHITGFVEIPVQTNAAIAPLPLSSAITVLISLFMDKQTNNDVMDPNELYVNKALDKATAPVGFRNLKFMHRYKVLADKVCMTPVRASSPLDKGPPFVPQVVQQINGVKFPFSLYHRFPKGGQKMIFSDTMHEIEAISDFSLQMLAIGSDDFGQFITENPTISYQSRLRYLG